ncbi:hypothetical protein [Streptomyces antarcticus]|uniref:hypothetical protein n=1 Tax=Streptomyces antarcticus TaxID=2996458 RepID=UPI00226F7BB9|nr:MULTISPECIES: hypothetical protein [unclassified Streptomyces]MCY0940294.1 hypothetical protein [Streptomyces sp. H34-AA3]MCZ4088279.1 hypothetical protein [Streptomyces sp. H34-S5]
MLLTAAEVLLERVPALTERLIGDLAKHSPLFDLAVPRDEHWQQVSEAMRYGIEAFAARRCEPRKDLAYAQELGRRRAEQGLPVPLPVAPARPDRPDPGPGRPPAGGGPGSGGRVTRGRAGAPGPGGSRVGCGRAGRRAGR